MLPTYFYCYLKLCTRLLIAFGMFVLVMLNASSILAIDEFQALGEAGSANAGSSASLNVPLTSPATISIGHHLTLRVIIAANRTIAIVDPRGNVWQQDALAQVGTSTSRTAIFSAKVETAYQAGDNITVNLTGGTAAMAVIVDEWAGLVATSWTDTSSSAGMDASNPSSTVWNSGNTATTSQDKVLLLGTIGMNAGVTSATPEVLTPTWTALTTETSTTFVRTVAGHYRQINAIGTPAYIGNFSTTRTHTSVIVVYKLQVPTDPPLAPSALTADPTHTNRVKLAWQDNANDENGFKIERAPDSSGSPGTYSEIASLGSDVVSYTDYSTNANLSYWYRAYAHNDLGNSANSSVVMITTPTGSNEGDNAVPVDIGIWIDKAELDAIPITGSDPRVAWWDLMKGAADDVWPSPDIYNDGKANIYAMAGALTFARLKPVNGSVDIYADSMRDKVRDAISSLTQITMDTAQENTRPSRLVTAYVIAADLIRLKDFDPQLDDTFRAWLNTVMYTDFNTGGNAPAIYDQCSAHVSNTANMSRTFCTATFWYLDNQTELDNTALWTASFFGDAASRATHAASATPFNWQMSYYNADPWFSSSYGAAEGGHFWQPTPGDSSTYYGVLPIGSFKLDRNGNQVNTDGVVPLDWGRNGPFVAGDSPYTSKPHDPPFAITNYNWTTLRGIAPAVVMLERAGYPAKDWGDQGLRRIMEANLRFYQLYSSRDWVWSTNSINEWLPPLINYVYGTNYLNDFVRTTSNGINGQGENVGWTQWTMGVVPAEVVSTPSNNNSSSSNSSSSSSNSTSASCSDSKPTRTPELFRVDANDTAAKIYFSPVTPERTTYLISYGRKNTADEYNVIYEVDSTGVIVMTIDYLNPNTEYYFKVSAFNGCTSGDFGTVMRIVTQNKLVKNYRIFDLYSSFQRSNRIISSFKLARPSKNSTSSLKQNVVASSTPSPTTPSVQEVTNTPVQETKSKSANKFCILFWCF